MRRWRPSRASSLGSSREGSGAGLRARPFSRRRESQSNDSSGGLLDEVLDRLTGMTYAGRMTNFNPTTATETSYRAVIFYVNPAHGKTYLTSRETVDEAFDDAESVVAGVYPEGSTVVVQEVKTTTTYRVIPSRFHG